MNMEMREINDKNNIIHLHNFSVYDFIQLGNDLINNYSHLPIIFTIVFVATGIL